MSGRSTLLALYLNVFCDLYEKLTQIMGPTGSAGA